MMRGPSPFLNHAFSFFWTSWELNITIPLAFVGIGLFLVIINNTSPGPNLRHIPSFGPSGRLTSFIGCYMFLRNTCGVLQDQVNKHKGGVFRVPFPDHWEVVVSEKKYVNEIAHAHDDDLSADDPAAEVLQVESTMGPSIKDDRYHVGVVGSTLTRSLAAEYNDIYDEISNSVEDAIRDMGKGDTKDWVSVPAFDAASNIVARTSNRLFVGLPLCRSLNYLYTAQTFAVEVLLGSLFINFMPWILRPLCQWLVAFRRRNSRQPGKDELKKYVVERLRLDKELGVERFDRPNDSISWCYDIAQHRYPAEGLVDEVVERIMVFNFAALHTTTQALTNALFHLAEHPDRYIEPLRNEVKEVIARHGWTKAALRDMVKIDSFVRESERMNGLGSLILTRKVVNPNGFTLSNGVHLPKGTIVSSANFAIHHDEEHYTNSNTFDGFRFSNIREAAEGFDTKRHQLVCTTSDFIAFGHGRHSCPGRFLVATELKTALAYIVLHYDMKLSDECNGVKPPNAWISTALIPDKQARICFRRREEVPCF